MADAGDGMHKEHPRSAIAHHFFDALAHLGLVAMHLAVGTKSLCLHKRALVTAHSRIIIQCLTLFAETLVFLIISRMISLAVDTDHIRNHSFFPFSFFYKFLTGQIFFHHLLLTDASFLHLIDLIGNAHGRIPV